MCMHRLYMTRRLFYDLKINFTTYLHYMYTLSNDKPLIKKRFYTCFERIEFRLDQRRCLGGSLTVSVGLHVFRSL